ncbi:MAG: AmmeMemoRadiSam system protein B [Planctomycetales bacterium]
MTTIRPPAVAGQFYPARSRELEEMIRDWLETGPLTPSTVPPKALIVPHAGYIYSGEVAANAFRLLKPFHAVIQRVVLIGPAHRVPLTGLSMSGADWFETPLGKIPIDKRARLLLERYPQISIQDAPHVAEHSLEVQLPFLQLLLDQFELIPLVKGARDRGRKSPKFWKSPGRSGDTVCDQFRTSAIFWMMFSAGN